MVPETDAADAADDVRAKRLYVGVFVCEAVAILALWAFGRMFS